MDYPGKNKSIASLVLGIVSIVIAWWGWIGLLGLAAGIVGIILAINAKKEMAAAENAPTGMVTAALVLSIIGAVLSGIFFVSCAICTGAAACAGQGALNELNRELNNLSGELESLR